MACKYRKKCSLFRKANPTCAEDDGGPFVNGVAYCGRYRFLEDEAKAKKKLLLAEA